MELIWDQLGPATEYICYLLFLLDGRFQHSLLGIDAVAVVEQNIVEE